MAKKKSKAKAKIKAKAKTKKAKKSVKRAAARAKPAKAKKNKKSARRPAKAAAKPVKKAKKTIAKKKKQTIGEGDYEATRRFDKDQSNFVKRNAAKIPAMGKAAEQALDGPEGDSLREAEATAADRSRDHF